MQKIPPLFYVQLMKHTMFTYFLVKLDCTGDGLLDGALEELDLIGGDKPSNKVAASQGGQPQPSLGVFGLISRGGNRNRCRSRCAARACQGLRKRWFRKFRGTARRFFDKQRTSILAIGRFVWWNHGRVLHLKIRVWSGFL